VRAEQFRRGIRRPAATDEFIDRSGKIIDAIEEKIAATVATSAEGIIVQVALLAEEANLDDAPIALVAGLYWGTFLSTRPGSGRHAQVPPRILVA
jgi:hypothetical protein